MGAVDQNSSWAPTRDSNRSGTCVLWTVSQTTEKNWVAAPAAKAAVASPSVFAAVPSRISGAAAVAIATIAGTIGRRIVSLTITRAASNPPMPRALSTNPQFRAPIVADATTGPRICQTPRLTVLKTAKASVTVQIQEWDRK
jgi:hypothetical protein